MKRALGLSPWSKCVMSARRETILGSIREARAILRGESAGELVGHVPPEADVKALRRKVRHGNYRRAFDDSVG